MTNFLHLAEVLHQVTSEKPMSPSSRNLLRAKMEEKDRSKEEFQVRWNLSLTKSAFSRFISQRAWSILLLLFQTLGFLQRRKGTFTYHSANGDLVVDLRELALKKAWPWADWRNEGKMPVFSMLLLPGHPLVVIFIILPLPQQKKNNQVLRDAFLTKSSSQLAREVCRYGLISLI